MLLGLLAAAALAATPTPDRPHVSRSGYLVAPSTLEMEAGASWSEAGHAAPALVKYAFEDYVEGRIGVDLASLDGAPSLEAGTKIRIVNNEDVGLAAYLASAVPTSSRERWHGTAQGLLTIPFEPAYVQLNAGALLVGAPGGVRFGGMPLAALAGVGFGRTFTGFAEVAALAGGECQGAMCQGLVDVGVGWLLTDILRVDAGVGWDLDWGGPRVQAGLAANLGRFRAL